MKIKSAAASETIKSAQQTLELLLRQSKDITDSASNNWTDSMKHEFFKKYIKEFIEIQERTQSDLKSIYLSVSSIENMLKQNIN